jgi:hypothetical protein
MGWHRPDKDMFVFDGISAHSICRDCGRDITQDSNMDWFSFQKKAPYHD